jgi:hypothetical protein
VAAARGEITCDECKDAAGKTTTFEKRHLGYIFFF